MRSLKFVGLTIGISTLLACCVVPNSFAQEVNETEGILIYPWLQVGVSGGIQMRLATPYESFAGWIKLSPTFRAYNSQQPGTAAYYEYAASNNRYSYSKDPLGAGWTKGRLAFYAYPHDISSPPKGTLPVFGYQASFGNQGMKHLITPEATLSSAYGTGWSKWGVHFHALPLVPASESTQEVAMNVNSSSNVHQWIINNVTGHMPRLGLASETFVGWQKQRAAFRAHTSNSAGTVPIYEYSASHNRFTYSRYAMGPGWEKGRLAFHAYEKPVKGTIPVYGYFAENVIDGANLGHKYMITPEIIGGQGWTKLGVVFFALPPDLEEKERELRTNVDLYLTFGEQGGAVTHPISNLQWPAATHGKNPVEALAHRIVKSENIPDAPIKSGDIVALEIDAANATTHVGYNRLYVTQLGWVYYDAPASMNVQPKQWWVIEKVSGGDADPTLRNGDVVLLRNRNWKDYYLNATDDDHWLSASANGTPIRLQLKEIPKNYTVRSTQGNKVSGSIESWTFVGNAGLSGSEGLAKEVFTIESTQSVQFNDRNTHINEGGFKVSLGAQGGPEDARFTWSAEITASFKREYESAIERADSITTGKTLEINYPLEADAEVFARTLISVPYVERQLSCNGETAFIWEKSGSMSFISRTAYAIPNRDPNTKAIRPRSTAEVEELLKSLQTVDAAQATELRNIRLPVWKRNGWVVDDPSAVQPPSPPAEKQDTASKKGSNNKKKNEQKKKNKNAAKNPK